MKRPYGQGGDEEPKTTDKNKYDDSGSIRRETRRRPA